jgi:signal transduction histidine kinase
VFSRLSRAARRPLWTILAGLCLLVACAGGAGPALGQTIGDASLQESRASLPPGMPFPSEHYPAAAYGGTSRNWAVTQDMRGVIYLGGKMGLFAYDSERWTRLPLPGQPGSNVVRSLTVDSSGTLYVGLSGDLGMVTQAQSSSPTYRSLIGPDSSAPDFDDIWSTFRCDGATYFQAREALFRWDGDSLDYVSTEAGIHTAFCVSGTVFVRDFDRGLLSLRPSAFQKGKPPSDDRLVQAASYTRRDSVAADPFRMAPGGNRFTDTSVHVMLRRPDGSILVGTGTDGLYVLRSTGLERLETPINDRLREYRLYTGERIADGVYALSTIGGGIFLINDDAELLRHLEPDRELAGSTGNDLHVGRDGQLWIAFHNAGLQRINVLSSVTRFSGRHGLSGLIEWITRHDDSLYVGTGDGAYLFSASDSYSDTPFLPIEDVPPVLDFTSTSEGLLAATTFGLYVIDGRTARQITDETVFTSIASEEVGGRFYLGMRDGLAVMNSINSEPTRLPFLDSPVRSVKEDNSGTLWIPRDSVITRITLSDEALSAPFPLPGSDLIGRTWTVGASDGLKSPVSSVVTCGRAVYAFRRSGLQRLIQNGDRTLVRTDSTFLSGIDGSGDFFYLRTPENRPLWAGRGDQVYRSPPACGTDRAPEWRSVPQLNFPKSQSVVFHADTTGVAWVSDGNQLYRYNLRTRSEVFNDFRPIVTAVRHIGTDSLTYSGIPGPARRAKGDRPRFTLDFSQNDLRIDVAAPIYNTLSETEYQYRINGRSEDWSAWTTEPQITLTSLPEGVYSLHLRAKTERGEIRRGGPFVFRILPPWYRTSGAYFIYATLFALAIGGILYARSLYLENRRRREQAAQLRREEQRNRHLNTMNERLREANEKLRQANELKESFLASTSHELRTPLSSILGYADVLENEAPEDVQTFVDAIQDSGERLLSTLNRLLHLSGLRSGTYDVYYEPVDFTDLVQTIADDYRPQAEEKGLAFQVDMPDGRVESVTDRTACGQIIRNLLDNAIKFTHEGEVTLRLEDRHDAVRVTIQDTGVGISPEFRPKLFEDFEQESKGLTREYAGSGIGLAVSKRFADLVDATIELDSEPDVGTTVTVAFPRRTNGDGPADVDAS